MFEVLKYFGVSDIAYNQPKSPLRTPGADFARFSAGKRLLSGRKENKNGK